MTPVEKPARTRPMFSDSSRQIATEYDDRAPITLFQGDRLALLGQIADASAKAELVVTSPPYNTGKEYESQTSLSDYIAQQTETIQACLEILSPTGSICWQVGHYIEGRGRDKEAYPLDLVLYPVFKRFGLKLRNRIVWHFGHGLHETYRLTGRHETVLWFTRDTPDYTFNLDPIRVPQKYPGKRAFRGPNKGQPSGNPRGKNPSDVWDMPNVKANHVEKTQHPCQFPVALVERLVLALTNENDLVVDPYIGVGSTAVACVLHDRRCAGADTEARYLETAHQRIQQAWNGTLRIRPMNKPVYEPDTRSAVARVPKEWAPASATYAAGEPMTRRLCEDGGTLEASDDCASDAASE